MLTTLLASLAGLIHVYIFVLESVLWGRPKTNKVFGVSPEQAEQSRLFAFNQGFYNLFLAVAMLGGLALSYSPSYAIAGTTLTIYAGLSMFGAAIVLVCSQPKLIRAACIQGVPPVLALVLHFLNAP